MTETETRRSLADLTEQIKERERRLAYGSETVLWGHYLDRMEEVSGVSPLHVDEAPEATVPAAEAEWWLAAYNLYEERGGEYDDIQELFDAVNP